MGRQARPTYSELRKLDDAGMVASAWDAAERGPARRVYELTDAGRAGLARAAADMAVLAEHQRVGEKHETAAKSAEPF